MDSSVLPPRQPRKELPSDDEASWLTSQPHQDQLGEIFQAVYFTVPVIEVHSDGSVPAFPSGINDLGRVMMVYAGYE
jgi:hypothetical protein